MRNNHTNPCTVWALPFPRSLVYRDLAALGAQQSIVSSLSMRMRGMRDLTCSPHGQDQFSQVQQGRPP